MPFLFFRTGGFRDTNPLRMDVSTVKSKTGSVLDAQGAVGVYVGEVSERVKRATISDSKSVRDRTRQESQVVIA